MIHSQSTHLISSNFLSNKFAHGFGMRQFGNARDVKKTITSLKTIIPDLRSVVYMEQVHGAEIQTIHEVPNALHIEVSGVDGVVTKMSHVVLLVRTTDCVPLFFADERAGVIGAAHAGWRGTLGQIGKGMIDTMVQTGATLSDIHVAIGPAIGGCCYEIGADVVEKFQSAFPQFIDSCFNLQSGKYYLSLTKLNFLILKQAGLVDNQIDFFPFCTHCDSDRFWSYRRGETQSLVNFIARR